MTHAAQELERRLSRIDGRGYKAYGNLAGHWRLDEGLVLSVDHVQGDPFAAPSRLSVHLSPARLALAPHLLNPLARRVGVAAFLARSFARAAPGASRPGGTGRGGMIEMEDPGQRVLAQTAVQLSGQGSLEARFTLGLPARQRRVAGREAAELLLGVVPELVRSTLIASAHEAARMEEAARVNEDADALRTALRDHGLVAFVADGSVLPRRSGVDDHPLEGERVVRFRSSEELCVTLPAPNAGPLTGLGIRRGVTLIVGGGFHGKSTLLRAIEEGVYNHAPGDGRERAVTDECAVKIRAEDGRSVAGVDISPFIDGLPGGEDTTHFTTPNASGSTSQAAALAEALEAGARVLLVDEDTAATNFMIRDRRMQALVPTEDEPITPFVDRVHELYERRGVSSVLVLGGSGDYLDVADTILRMDAFQPFDVTARARQVSCRYPTRRRPEAARPLGPPAQRVPDPTSVDPRRGRQARYVRVRGESRLLFGREAIDLGAVEPELNLAQVRAIGLGLALARSDCMDGRRPLARVLDLVLEVVAEGGLDALDPWKAGDLQAFRRFELAAALNRLRTLRVIRTGT